MIRVLAMQEILSMVLFGTFPQLFDIVVSCAYLAFALQPWIALIVFVLLITYIPLRCPPSTHHPFLGTCTRPRCLSLTYDYCSDLGIPDLDSSLQSGFCCENA